MKRCTKCGELKPESEFYAAPGCKDGLRGDCKDCHRASSRAWYAANRESFKAYVTQWKRDHPERMREYRARQDPSRRAAQMRRLHLKRKFGMTMEQYDLVLAAQDGGCAICGDPPVDGRSMHVDHRDADVRGILCVRCNNALGQLRDDPELMLRAAEYVTLGGFAPLKLVCPDATRAEQPDR
jgi:hypothetical protein